MGEAQCPICGGKPGDRIEQLQGQSGAVVSLLICEMCGNVFTARREHPESRPSIERAKWRGEYDDAGDWSNRQPGASEALAQRLLDMHQHDEA
jgi:hypothetical protein